MQLVFLRMLLLDFLAAQSLEDAQMPLTQSRISDDLMPCHARYLFGRLNGATEITTVQRRETLPRQPLRQGFRLGHALFCQPTIEITLANALDIPFRLTMTDDDQLGTLH